MVDVSTVNNFFQETKINAYVDEILSDLGSERDRLRGSVDSICDNIVWVKDCEDCLERNSPNWFGDYY